MTGREVEKLMKGQLTPVFDINGKQLKMGEKIRQVVRHQGKAVNIGKLGFDTVGWKYIMRVEGGGVELRSTSFESLEVE